MLKVFTVSVQEGVGVESYCSHVHSVEKGNPTGQGLSPTNSRVCLSDLGARCVCVCVVSMSVLISRSGVLRTQKLQSSSVENPTLTNVLPFKAWNRSKYSHACFAYCQEFLPCPDFYLPGPFTFVFSPRSFPTFGLR